MSASVRTTEPAVYRRQLTGLDELRHNIDVLVAGREHDDRHGLQRCRGGRLVEGLIEILPFQIRVGREGLGRPGVDALPDLPLLRCHLGAKLEREDVHKYDAFDFVRMLVGEDPCDSAAERVRDEDVRARYVGCLRQGDEVVDPVLRIGRLGHRVAAAEGLVEVRRTGSVVGAHDVLALSEMGAQARKTSHPPEKYGLHVKSAKFLRGTARTANRVSAQGISPNT
jgi:hypothetical protein